MRNAKIPKPTDQVKVVLNGVLDGEYDIEHILTSLKLNFNAFNITMMDVLMRSIIDNEVEKLAGLHHERTGAHRWSSAPGYVVAGGTKVKIQRPRLRDKTTKKEIELSSYKKFQQDEPWCESVLNRMISGVSARKYTRTVEEFSKSYGISKSTISRKVIKATAEKLKDLMDRRLDHLHITVLAIDGVHIGGTAQIVAIGVDSDGKKHILGFRQGATENTAVTLELFKDLASRGLDTSHPVLVVIDGSKALQSAVKKYFDDQALIQRCQFHKLRNVCEHLPKKYQGHFARKLKAAYAMKTYDDAKEALVRIVVELDRINESAANSLREGLEETLTVQRLGLPDVLRKSFSNTNIIESAFSVGRDMMHNVKRWSTNDQVHRYLATALLEAEHQFRKVRGHRSMSVLIAALDQEMMKSKFASQIKVA
jgi:transposase-like protein